MSKEGARKYIVNTDANRNAFVKPYFNSDAHQAENYDLVLNTGILTVEKVVEIITCAIR